MDQISIYKSLLKQNRTIFDPRLIMGDEKWIMYDNNVRKRLGKITPSNQKKATRIE